MKLRNQGCQLILGHYTREAQAAYPIYAIAFLHQAFGILVPR